MTEQGVLGIMGQSRAFEVAAAGLGSWTVHATVSSEHPLDLKTFLTRAFPIGLAIQAKIVESPPCLTASGTCVGVVRTGCKKRLAQHRAC